MALEIGRLRPAQFPISGERGGVRGNRGSISRLIVAAGNWNCLKQEGLSW